MKPTIIRSTCLLLLLPLLVACSLGAAADETPQQSISPTARPVAVQSSVSISGRLLFVQDGNLYLHQGTQTRQVTKDGTTRDPAWAPDGSRIAFVRREESYSDIYLLNEKGGLPIQVTFNRIQGNPRSQDVMHQLVWATSPTWTADSSEIIFLSQVAPPPAEPLVEYPLSIYRYPLRLIGQRQPTNDDILVRAEEADFQRPAWAADNSLLAFVRIPRSGGTKQIVVFNPENGTEQSYPGIPQQSYDPVWSPDARWLAFTAQVDGRTDVWAIPHPARGGSAVRLTNSGTARAPEWSPDGKQLAFVQIGNSSADLFVMPVTEQNGALAGGEATSLTTNGQIDANSGLSWGQ
jgi:TolB protein